MEDKFSRFLRGAAYKADPALPDKIWHKLVLHNRKTAKIKLAIFSFLGAISALGIIPAFVSLSGNFQRSGTYEYLSVAFSTSEAASIWKELLYSVAESLPILSIVLFFSLLFAFFISIKYAMKQVINSQLLNAQA